MTLTLNGSPAAITLINGWEFFLWRRILCPTRSYLNFYFY